MWVSKKKIMNLEKRIADLEKSQLKAINMVKNYIEDTESLSKKIDEEINKLPQAINDMLTNYYRDK